MKKDDVRRSILELSGERLTAGISTRYLQHEITRERAISLAERTNRGGKLMAAELLIEEAFDSAGSYHAIEAVQHANDLLTKVETEYGYSGKPDEQASYARARMLKAQMPGFGSVTSSAELPSQKVLANMYFGSVLTAFNLALDYSALKNPKSDKELSTRSNLKGILSEASVLLLAQRFSMKNDLSRSWFPLFSLHRENHSNGHGATFNTASDISIFTDLDSIPMATYGIQVKSFDNQLSRPTRSLMTDARGVRFLSEIHLNPMLCSRKDKRERFFDSSTIVRECYSEMHMDNNSDNSVTRRLDARTERLLEIIDGSD